MSHEGAARVRHLQPREVLFPCPTNYRVSYVLSYDQQDFLQDGDVSESFTHKMAAWKICLKDGGNAAFLRVLPTRWRRGRFAYEMAAFLRSLPTICRRGNFAYKMAAFLRVLPTRWRRQTKRKQKQRRIHITFS